MEFDRIFSLKKSGFFAFIFGIIMIVWASLFDTAPEGAYNIGALQSQMMIAQLGGLSILIGSIFLTASKFLPEKNSKSFSDIEKN